ncbi:hypothetical protein Krac_10381 [Ktedonobacter racemifer DSM 44963]|uniref:Uncharacterized protein n=1 Tax=Ktedonobacter racemifer DSM 44963 TaxID=485913 RepID=D6TGU6_KTERA|nr:hypothetical protein Krac_10381 [Ktedonobacter racemifer DSM 44963]
MGRGKPPNSGRSNSQFWAKSRMRACLHASALIKEGYFSTVKRLWEGVYDQEAENFDMFFMGWGG